MPTITLVPFNSSQGADGRSAWTQVGASNWFKAISDGLYMSIGIALGAADSNGLYASDWRDPATGLAFSWTGKAINSVALDWAMVNNGATTTPYFAFYHSLNGVPAAGVEIYNGLLNIATIGGGALWQNILNSTDAGVANAVKSNAYLAALIFYNHVTANQGVLIDGARLRVDYTNLFPPKLQPTEI